MWDLLFMFIDGHNKKLSIKNKKPIKPWDTINQNYQDYPNECINSMNSLKDSYSDLIARTEKIIRTADKIKMLINKTLNKC
tara:strand:+ start:212 stop:454 length:243 start_codon:yes stop_codon:yes gene_type:complete